MKKVKGQTEKILYNGKNHDSIHRHFRKWELEWNFKTNLYTHHHNSYEQTIKGDIRADLIINKGSTIKPCTVPFDRYISFIKLDDNEIIINIESVETTTNLNNNHYNWNDVKVSIQGKEVKFITKLIYAKNK